MIKNIKPEKIFLLYSIIFGLLFILVTPPYQIPDENYHFYHAFTISEFYAYSDNGYESVPKSFIEFDTLFTGISFHPDVKIKPDIITSLLGQDLIPDSRREQLVNPATPFTFVLYIPQVIGIWTGRVFSFPPIIIYYLGRLFAMFFWILIVYFSFKIIPFKKWTYILIVLTPISLFLAGSYSADSVLNSLSFLFVSLIFYYAYDNRQSVISWKKIILMVLISSAITTSKPPYIILLLIYFLIPVNKFRNKKSYYITFALILILNLLLIYIWNNLALTPINSNTSGLREQIILLVNNPFDLIKKLISTYWERYQALSQQFVGKLGWLDTELPDVMIIIYLFTFILTAGLDRSGIKADINLRQKLFSAVIFLIFITLIFTLFYFLTPNEEKIIWGVQGRYFIPFYLLLLILFYNDKFNVKDNLIKLVVIVISFVSLSVTVYTLVNRYFIL